MGFVERFVTKFVRLIRPFDSIVFLFFIYIFGFLVNWVKGIRNKRFLRNDLINFRRSTSND